MRRYRDIQRRLVQLETSNAAKQEAEEQPTPEQLGWLLDTIVALLDAGDLVRAPDPETPAIVRPGVLNDPELEQLVNAWLCSLVLWRLQPQACGIHATDQHRGCMCTLCERYRAYKRLEAFYLDGYTFATLPPRLVVGADEDDDEDV